VRLLAVDPGRDKCGIAVVDERDGVLSRGVVPASVIGIVTRDWMAAHRPAVVVLGKGTGYREVRSALIGISVPLEVVAEAHTTRRARSRYFQEHPPRGWRRLIPAGLLLPPVPVDDYAAVLIAEDYLRQVRQERRARHRK
jgi:RNase H-fold protein (predicted Holliday junction resolvase)